MTQPDLVWSNERPTESGNYWLSVHPDKRGSEWDEVEYVRVTIYAAYKLVCVEPPCMVCDKPIELNDPFLDGAKWAKRSLPFDPFAARHPCSIDL